jgi:ribonuclease J
MMNATTIFIGDGVLKNNFRTFAAWQSFMVGDFKITPYLVDHSAFDAYAFLVECDDKKIFYSGDFRASGRKSKLFHRMLRDEKLKNPDVLLMEGTMLHRENADFPDETSVEAKIYESLVKTDCISFMIGSSQNIDRLVSAYRACKRNGKIFVIDIYTAWILDVASKKAAVPNIDWHEVRVVKKYGGGYYEKIKEHKDFFADFPVRLFKNVITLGELQANPSRFFLKISPRHIESLLSELGLNAANVFYSQWSGYMEPEFSDDKTVRLFENLRQKYNWIYAHTSGHADLQALKLFCSSLQPKTLIPIHTEHKADFEEHFENVVVLEDGETYQIGQNLSDYRVKQLNELFADELEEAQTIGKRSLNEKFMVDLREGLLQGLLEVVKKDATLDLQFRGNRVDVYYRGGLILHLAQEKTGYRMKTNENCLVYSLKPEFPKKISEKLDTQKWADNFARIKQAEDFNYSRKNITKREILQLIVRSNNYEHTAGNTDFILTDMDYQSNFGKIDLSGLHIVKNCEDRLLTTPAFVKVVFGNETTKSASDLNDYEENIYQYVSANNGKDFQRFKKDTQKMVAQKLKLGLLAGKKIDIISTEDPLLVIILADQGRADNNLRHVIQDVSPGYSDMDIRFALAGVMGYGLYSECLFSKSQFLQYIDEDRPYLYSYKERFFL